MNQKELPNQFKQMMLGFLEPLKPGITVDNFKMVGIFYSESDILRAKNNCITIIEIDHARDIKNTVNLKREKEYELRSIERIHLNLEKNMHELNKVVQEILD